MKIFDSINEMVASIPRDGGVRVDNTGLGGFIYDSVEVMNQHEKMGAAGDPTRPQGCESFQIRGNDDLVTALIAIGAIYDYQ